MAEDINNPLLSLLHGQWMLDDLQYEEVVGELQRNATPAIQILQDFGIMKLDDILHVEATALGTEVIQLKDRQIPAEVLSLIPAKVAQMYKCLPVGFANGMLQVALAEPLDPAKADEINFIAKRAVQNVVADPAEIGRAIERLYGQEENESFAEILKELGDEKLERDAKAAGDDVKAAEDLANQVPIVKFVNLVLQQAVIDRASDIHF